MPFRLSPTKIGFNPREEGPFKLPFQEQIDFFNKKLALPSNHYDDIIKDGHDKGFIVAGAAKADLLSDIHGAVAKAINEGKTLSWFKDNFEDIAQKHGWGYNGSLDWRSRVIYQTNLSSSYAAGRYRQLMDPDLLKVRPYWKYIHNDSVHHPRPLHQSWNGTVLRYDNPWWQTHFCPNGSGCRCRVMAVSASEYKRHPAPDDGTHEVIDRWGNKHTLPNGVDYGFDYIPGKSQLDKALSIQKNKLEDLPYKLAQSNVNELLKSPIFERFFSGHLDGEFPIGILSDVDKKVLDTKVSTVLLSQESLTAHLATHPEVGINDYLNVPEILEHGEVYKQDDQRLVYLRIEGINYRAALKRTADGEKNYFLTLFKMIKAKSPKGAIKVR